MAKPLKTPSYRLHRASGLAVVTLRDVATGRRRDVYLGDYNTPDSLARFDAVVAQWLGNGRRIDNRVVDELTRGDGVTVTVVIRDYWRFACDRFEEGSSTLTQTKTTLKLLRAIYGNTPANTFGPLMLGEVRKAMIGKGWGRGYVNRMIGILKAAFKRAVANELVEPSVYQALECLPNLTRGEQGVREGGRVKPVPEADIAAVCRVVSPTIRAVIELQLLTAARAGELLIMRPVDLDTTGTIWLYRPASHKTERHGHERIIYIGKRGQAILNSFMPGRPLTGFVFSPREAEDARLAELHAKRKTPLSCGNRPGTNRKTAPKVSKGDRYTTDSYRRAIERGCDKAKASSWTPHRLRHNAATRLRKEFDVEIARVILGHRAPSMTERYAELDHAKAIDAIGKVG